jgi:hypothetical protein
MLSRPTALVGIIIANTIPILGILFAGWDWREILIFYWLGNITVGVLLVINLIRAPSLSAVYTELGKPTVSGAPIPEIRGNMTTINANQTLFMKIFVIGFFCFHYGMFTLVHGVFVFAITAGTYTIDGIQTSNADLAPLNIAQILLFWIIASVTFIAVQLMGERSNLTIQGVYARMITLHVSILLGVFLISVLDWPASAALLLVFVNFFFDLKLYGGSKKPLLVSQAQV